MVFIFGFLISGFFLYEHFFTRPLLCFTRIVRVHPPDERAPNAAEPFVSADGFAGCNSTLKKRLHPLRRLNKKAAALGRFDSRRTASFLYLFYEKHIRELPGLQHCFDTDTNKTRVQRRYDRRSQPKSDCGDDYYSNVA